MSLASPLVQLSVTVDANGTCISSLQLNLTALAMDNAGGGGPDLEWTPNLASGGGAPCGAKSSGTALELASRPRALLLPTGGSVASQNATHMLVTGIAVGAVASEEWEISLPPPGAGDGVFQQLRWHVRRTYAAADTATTDLFPAIWLQSTTGGYDRGSGPGRGQGRPAAPPPVSLDWRARVQMPSFFSLDSTLINVSSGAGWAAASGALASAWGAATAGAAQQVLLSPMGAWMRVAVDSGRFSFSRYSASWFEPELGIGAECAAGPDSTGYAFEPGDVRSNALTASFYPATGGLARFALSAPADSPAAGLVRSASTFAAVYAMLLGWLNGNSPQSTTCIHEASLFSQLQGLFSLSPPAPDAPPAAIAGGDAPCGAFSNPFCGQDFHVDNVSLTLSCAADGGTIAAVDASYGQPSLGPRCSLQRDAACDWAPFQAMAEAACLNKSTCTLARGSGDFDPCPDKVKGIAAVAKCSGGGGGRVPPPQPCPTVHAAAAAQLSFILANSVNVSGRVAARWDVVGGNAWMGIIDQMPNVLLMAYYHAVNTNDSAQVREWMPQLDRIAGYMRAPAPGMDIDATLLLTNNEPQCDGRANVSCADNWLDDVRFGFRDAIVGVYAVEAFRALGDLKLLVGDGDGAQEYYDLHAKMVDAFNAFYWVEDPELCAGCGYYSDWVDIQGNARKYLYVWQQFAAIEFGVANSTQAAAILASADALYADVRAAYNKTEAQLWCTPTNLRGLRPEDLTLDFDSEYEYGQVLRPTPTHPPARPPPPPTF